MEKNTPQKKSSILRFFPFTKGFRLSFILSLLLVLIGVVANYLTPQVIRITVDSVIGNEPFALPEFIMNMVNKIGGRNALVKHIFICASASLILAAIAAVSDFFAKRCLAISCEGTAKRIRDRLFSHIQRLPYNWHNKNQTGDIIQRCTTDVETIMNFMNEQLTVLLRTVFLIVVALLFMFPMNTKLSLIALGFLPVTVAYSMIFYYLTAKNFQAADECEGQLTAITQENLTGVRVVRAFGREKFELDKFHAKNQEFTDRWKKLGRVMGWNWGIGDIISSAQIIVICIFGVIFTVHGELTSGEFLAFVSYNSMLVWPVRMLGRVLAELSKTSISATRLFEILDAEEEKDCENPYTGEIKGDIEFKNVSFSYVEGADTVQNISFKVKEGTTLGILGATGSGKSTLMYLLDRLYELPEGNGEISIGGIDIRKMRIEDLRRQIGIVLQEPFLFSKSFKDTIADGAGTNSLEEVRKYADFAVIDDTIQTFAEGYDTQIGERGVTISGGQKQRVAIARMLMQNTPIKIFDDSLSAVDMETDAKIRESIKNNVNGTTIIIAHRITTIMNADKIIVLDKGRLVQEGTHDELIKTEGIYKKIYDTQRAAD
ncbi:MAG: ABC transporter ATP-binding protein [Clostridia bacterium]|nr:ABC transporter ATP-binding protein [Clostridia bacterium]